MVREGMASFKLSFPKITESRQSFEK